jgi:protease I
MEANKQSNRKIAIVATDGFEHSELTEPKRLLEKAGMRVDVIAPEGAWITSWKNNNWGEKVKVDATLDKADASHYDALVVPGGVINPDKLRLDRRAVEFIRQFAAQGKPIAAICHGPQMLIEADLVRGRQITSWPSLQTDLKNAGAQWHDREVVQDGDLITSRKPDDIPAFVAALIATLAAGARDQRKVS